jgi:large subunit ribosomal protein L18e
MKRVKNEQVMQLITALNTLASEKKVNLWKRIAVELDKPTRSKREVNVFKIDTVAKDGEVVVVPGKVLGSGVLSKKLTVAALSFSDSAKEKIVSQQGEVLSIEELMKKNPEGKQVRIMG